MPETTEVGITGRAVVPGVLYAPPTLVSIGTLEDLTRVVPKSSRTPDGYKLAHLIIGT